MRTPFLHEELRAATSAVTPSLRRWLASLGYEKAADRCAGGVGVAKVRIDGRFFEPEDGGVPQLIWPVWTGPISSAGYCEGELIDLLAWHPKRPTELLRRTGLGIALGMAAIERAASAGISGMVTLFRTPFSWAAAGGDAGGGAMVLEWRADNGLFSVAKIVCEDADHADIVGQRLELLQLRLLPRLPEIQFNNPKVRTA